MDRGVLRENTGLTNRAIGDIVSVRYPVVRKAGLTVKRFAEEDRKLKRTINKIISIFQI